MKRAGRVADLAAMRPARHILLLLALLLLARTTLVINRRRTVVPGTLALPELPAPAAGTPSGPAVKQFEYVAAGGSALLRVKVDGAERQGATLIVDHGHVTELLEALPMTMPGGSLGFACDRELVEAPARYWLQAGDELVPLGRPSERVLA